MAFLVTCEHGSQAVPSWLLDKLAAKQAGSNPSHLADDLQTTLADSDAGAMDASKHFAKTLRCRMISADYSPRVVDVNRAARNPAVFSKLTRSLPRADRARLIREIHEPYRQTVERTVEKLIQKEQLVIHLSIHSFATFQPNLADGECRAEAARRTDVGLLYDPARDFELALCLDWYDDLYYALPMLRVRRNYPRRGVFDSLIRTLRRRFSPDSYIGIELQLNRAWCVRDVPVRKKVFTGLAKSLMRICDLAEVEPDSNVA